jgi:hypothetical protein
MRAVLTALSLISKSSTGTRSQPRDAILPLKQILKHGRPRLRGPCGAPNEFTLLAIEEPENVRGAKDLLGHSTFATTEKYYVMAQSRLAGRAPARAIEKWQKGQLHPDTHTALGGQRSVGSRSRKYR